MASFNGSDASESAPNTEREAGTPSLKASFDGSDASESAPNTGREAGTPLLKTSFDGSDASESAHNTDSETGMPSLKVSGYVIVSGPNENKGQNTFGPTISKSTLYPRDIYDSDVDHPIKKLHQTYADLKFQITKLRIQIDSQRETINNVSEKYAKKKQEAAFYEEDAKIEKIHVESLMSEIRTLRDTVQTLLEAKAKLHDEIDSYHSNEEHASQIAGLKHDVDNDHELHELTNVIEKLEHDLHKKEDDNQKLIQEMAQVKSEMAQMKGDFHEQMEDMKGELNNQLVAMTGKLDQLLTDQNPADNANEPTHAKKNGGKKSHDKKKK